MSLPWDPENLVPNLITLAGLRRGDYLSVLKEGENVGIIQSSHNRGLRARFKIRRGIGKGFVGSKKGESILEDDQYLGPLSTFFVVAVEAFSHNQVSATQLMGGYQGLLELKRTYDDKGNQTKIRKMDEIVRTVRQKLPMVMMDGLFMEPGQHRLVLGQHISPEMAQQMMDNMKAINNEHVKNERETGVTPELIEEVFGTREPSTQPATWVPVTEHYYRRQGIGVCWQFWRDAHEGGGITLNWTRLTCSAPDLRRFLEFCDGDEALMFAVSQAANQGSLTGTPVMLMNRGAKENMQPVPLLHARGERVFMTFGGGGADIGKRGDEIVVTTVVRQDGNKEAFSYINGDMDPFSGKTRLLDFGITHFKLTLALKFRRNGGRIEMDLSRGEFQITTI